MKWRLNERSRRLNEWVLIAFLLVTGEHETKVGIEYFRRALPIIKQAFHYVAMEVQPLQQEEYAELIGLGLDAVMVYQETYHPSTYAQHHLRGNKTDFGIDSKHPIGWLERASIKLVLAR